VIETPKDLTDPVDRHLGQMIRARRLSIGLSQRDLAQALGLTFQQIQKYEKGVNRISASKLLAVARKLETPVSAFFDGLDVGGQGQSLFLEFAGFLELDGAADLARAYVTLSPHQRRRLVGLVEAMIPGPRGPVEPGSAP